jgi:hypothetical protein
VLLALVSELSRSDAPYRPTRAFLMEEDLLVVFLRRDHVEIVAHVVCEEMLWVPASFEEHYEIPRHLEMNELSYEEAFAATPLLPRTSYHGEPECVAAVRLSYA